MEILIRKNVTDDDFNNTVNAMVKAAGYAMESNLEEVIDYDIYKLDPAERKKLMRFVVNKAMTRLLDIIENEMD